MAVTIVKTQEGWHDIDDDEVEKLRVACQSIALPMLLGSDSANKWHVHAGKEKETGIVSSCSIKDYGTVWKLECVLDCSAEKFFKSITEDLELGWVPHLKHVTRLFEREEFHVLQQVTTGVPTVSDREFVTIQFPGKTCIKSQDGHDHTVYYSLCTSVADWHFDKSVFPDSVRGEYHPGGMAWQVIGENKCLFTFIYNIDLKGFLPKRLVNWAAAGVLKNFIKASQQQGIDLASKVENSRYIVPPSTAGGTHNQHSKHHNRH